MFDQNKFSDDFLLFMHLHRISKIIIELESEIWRHIVIILSYKYVIARNLNQSKIFKYFVINNNPIIEFGIY